MRWNWWKPVKVRTGFVTSVEATARIMLEKSLKLGAALTTKGGTQREKGRPRVVTMTSAQIVSRSIG